MRPTSPTDTAKAQPLDSVPILSFVPQLKIPLPGGASILPEVELPVRERLVCEFSKELGRELKKANAEIFVRNRQVLGLNENGDALEPISNKAFVTWIEKYVQCFVPLGIAGGVTIRQKKSISATTAANVLESPQFMDCLPQVNLVNTVSLPFLRSSGAIELLPRGYDAESKTYTSGALNFDQNLSLAEAKEFLEKLFAEFPFNERERSFSVQLSSMLTLFASGVLPKRIARPAFIWVANAEGAGKTLLAKAGVIAVLGKANIQPLSGDEEEIRKRLLASVMYAKATCFLDNIKGHLSSAALEGFLTGTEWEDRILGSSKTFAGEKNCTVLITGNSLTFSPDIRRRSLIVELFLQELKSENRTIASPIEEEDLHTLRPKILAALWALVREWDRAGRPDAKQTHGSFYKWSLTIGGILENAGYSSPTLPPDLRRGGDTMTKDLEALAEGMTATVRSFYSFEEIVELCRLEGLFDFMVEDGKMTTGGKWELNTGAKSKLGKYLANQHERLLGKGRFVVEGKGHRRRFYIEPVHPDPQEGIPF